MRTNKILCVSACVLGLVALFAACATQVGNETSSATSIRIDDDDIGGVVTSAKGPEGGVWVIAETHDLPTRYAKMVVTDDQGRYVIPDLPKANYDIWVRGYGLVDSPKVKATPGKLVDLQAVVSPDEAHAGGDFLSLDRTAPGKRILNIASALCFNIRGWSRFRFALFCDRSR